MPDKYDPNYYKEHKDRHRATQKKYAQEHPHKLWAAGTLQDHRSKGMVTEISTAELEIIALHVKFCEYCGKELVYRNKGGLCDASATLDRVDNEKVLRADNTKIVCYDCNATKRTKSFEEFVLYCKLIVDRFYTEVE